MIIARKKANKLQTEIAQLSEEYDEDAMEDEPTPTVVHAMPYGITTHQSPVTKVTDAKQPSKAAPSSDAKDMTSVTIYRRKKMTNRKPGKQPAKLTGTVEAMERKTGNIWKGGNKNLCTNSFKKLRGGKEVIL